MRTIGYFTDTVLIIEDPWLFYGVAGSEECLLSVESVEYLLGSVVILLYYPTGKFTQKPELHQRKK